MCIRDRPKFKEVDLGTAFKKVRGLSLILGNVLLTAASIITVFLALKVAETYSLINPLIVGKLSLLSVTQIEEITNYASPVIHLFLIIIFIRAFANILTSSAHLFYAEMLFDSNIIYFKVEGTFTESKISTGASIHDSTRSENTLIRSSITPWIIVSRIVTSTFAASGIRNLEYPRHIMEMHKNESELNDIRSDILDFLKDRESIASITSERDLNNASQIHQINQQSRAGSNVQQVTQADEEAAGYLRQEQDLNETESNK